MDNTVQILYISFATKKVWLLQLLQGEGAADGSSGSPPPMTEVDPAAEFLAKEQVLKLGLGQISGFAGHWNYPDTGYPSLEISRISGIRPKKYPAQP